MIPVNRPRERLEGRVDAHHMDELFVFAAQKHCSRNEALRMLLDTHPVLKKLRTGAAANADAQRAFRKQVLQARRVIGRK